MLKTDSSQHTDVDLPVRYWDKANETVEFVLDVSGPQSLLLLAVVGARMLQRKRSSTVSATQKPPKELLRAKISGNHTLAMIGYFVFHSGCYSISVRQASGDQLPLRNHRPFGAVRSTTCFP